MRTFMIYSSTAQTSAPIRDLKAAGRIDVLLHSIISALFASHTYREDVELHLFMMGPPNAPRHIFFRYHEDNTISKKDLKRLIEIALKRCKPGQTREVHPGVFVDDKRVEEVLAEQDTENIYMLDATGSHVKDLEASDLENPIFVLGDHDGFDKKTKKVLKKGYKRVSLGEQVYFTSQAITILNYELDNL